MLSVYTVLTRGWEAEDLFIPPGFFYNTWNLFLPKGSPSVLLSIMSYVIRHEPREELIRLMKIEESEQDLAPFQFDQPSADTDSIYLRNLEREMGIKAILERSGYIYPKNVEEFIYLFIQIGILLEVNYRGLSFFDIITEPFPNPSEALDLTDQEINRMLQQRQDYINQFN